MSKSEILSFKSELCFKVDHLCSTYLVAPVDVLIGTKA